MPGHLQEGFGCVVTNRFDQLPDDESDPSEILKAAENKKKEGAAAGSAKSAAQAAKQPKRESQKDRKNPLVDKKEESQPPVPLKKEGIRRVGRRPEQQQQQQGHQGSQHQGAQGDGRPIDKRPDRRPPRERRFEKPAEEKPEGGVGGGGDFSADKPSGERPPRGRGGGRGGRGGRGRGMGRGEGFESRGKRDFDRHSSTEKTNQKSEEKRSSSSSHNWGNVKEETSVTEPTPAAETTPEGEEQAPAGSENKENEVEEVKPEGPREMTLDEWKAMQDKERTKVEFNIRKPNEGADSQWKKGYVLHKSKSEDRPVGALIDTTETEVDAQTLYQKGTPDESSDHHFRKPANDITSQLEINFGDLGRPGRGRGGPRGGRGGRGGGGGRPARGGGRSEKASGVSVPNVDDPEAFPALA
ncbi:plasminogen activator inhibitor 1 RNA-binding protein-like [Corythoichthys intestinalis]|uniref:plasminogen activator inhibitor 1 RNA-binding protein-like n=1 Tax=Corythoichthys intestinalis TaxID=161448 RepID=UPI0025A51703|nr:plasminogen activator inhibitor 1 RNA-binding protein-like [Corythoichthys intestinalis]